MRNFSLITLVVLAIAVATVGPVAGQTATETPTESPADGERIDSNTMLVGSEWNQSKGVALITLRSDSHQSITLTDAGKFSTGGEVARRTVAVSPGETTTVEIPVTEVDGRVGVGINTDSTLYAEIIQGGGGPSPWEQTGSVTGWLGGASVAMTMTALAALKVKRKNPTEPEMMD